jgi:hypothetical protein
MTIAGGKEITVAVESKCLLIGSPETIQTGQGVALIFVSLVAQEQATC